QGVWRCQSVDHDLPGKQGKHRRRPERLARRDTAHHSIKGVLRMYRNPKHAIVVAAFLAFAISSASTPANAQLATPDSAQITLQATGLTFDGRLTFNGHGFVAGESCSVSIEDAQGGT